MDSDPTKKITCKNSFIREFKLRCQTFRWDGAKPRGGAYGEVFLYKSANCKVELAIKYFDYPEEAKLESAVVEHLNKGQNKCGVIPARVYQDANVGVRIIMEKAEPLGTHLFQLDVKERATQAQRITNQIFSDIYNDDAKSSTRTITQPHLNQINILNDHVTILGPKFIPIHSTTLVH